jgi:succinyl-CoA synthetase alpha subunit
LQVTTVTVLSQFVHMPATFHMARYDMVSTKVIFGVLLFSTLGFGQFETSEVLGTVRDASEKPVANAAVTLTNQDTGIEAKTTTDGSGNYDFFNVKVGRYTITVEQAGFSKFSSADIAVNVNARQRVDAALQVGAVTETVTVTDQASVVETDTSEHSQIIGTQAIVELPLNGRNYSSLALLATNVHVSPMASRLDPPARRAKAHSMSTECAARTTIS